MNFDINDDPFEELIKKTLPKKPTTNPSEINKNNLANFSDQSNSENNIKTTENIKNNLKIPLNPSKTTKNNLNQSENTKKVSKNDQNPSELNKNNNFELKSKLLVIDVRSIKFKNFIKDLDENYLKKLKNGKIEVEEEEIKKLEKIEMETEKMKNEKKMIFDRIILRNRMGNESYLKRENKIKKKMAKKATNLLIKNNLNDKQISFLMKNMTMMWKDEISLADAEIIISKFYKISNKDPMSEETNDESTEDSNENENNNMKENNSIDENENNSVDENGFDLNNNNNKNDQENEIKNNLDRNRLNIDVFNKIIKHDLNLRENNNELNGNEIECGEDIENKKKKCNRCTFIYPEKDKNCPICGAEENYEEYSIWKCSKCGFEKNESFNDCCLMCNTRIK